MGATESLFDKAARAHREAFYLTDGQTITYKQGEVEVEDLDAYRLVIRPAVEETEGVHSRGVDAVFVVRAEDLAVGSVPLVPKRGDEIVDEDGGRWDVQEDFELLTNAQEWRLPVSRVEE